MDDENKRVKEINRHCIRNCLSDNPVTVPGEGQAASPKSRLGIRGIYHCHHLLN